MKHCTMPPHHGFINLSTKNIVGPRCSQHLEFAVLVLQEMTTSISGDREMMQIHVVCRFTSWCCIVFKDVSSNSFYQVLQIIQLNLLPLTLHQNLNVVQPDWCCSHATVAVFSPFLIRTRRMYFSPRKFLISTIDPLS